MTPPTNSHAGTFLSGIHPTAIIDPSAQVGKDVSIGPYSIIGPNVIVGDGCQIAPHVVIEQNVTLGKGCQLASGCVIGGAPQDHSFNGEYSSVVIGDGTIIREFVTINRATGEGKVTQVGDHCLLMAYVHLAHNVKLHNNVTVASQTMLAGYVEIEDWVFVSGGVLVHQFVKIGRMAIVGGSSASRQDIPPFSLCDGRPARVLGINKVGLRRRGLSLADRSSIKRAYSLLWYSNLNYTQAIEAIKAEMPDNQYVDELIDFVLKSKRGIKPPILGETLDTTNQSESRLQSAEAYSEATTPSAHLSLAH